MCVSWNSGSTTENFRLTRENRIDDTDLTKQTGDSTQRGVNVGPVSKTLTQLQFSIMPTSCPGWKNTCVNQFRMAESGPPHACIGREPRNCAFKLPSGRKTDSIAEWDFWYRKGGRTGSARNGRYLIDVSYRYIADCVFCRPLRQHEVLTRYWANAGPPSTTSSQH